MVCLHSKQTGLINVYITITLTDLFRHLPRAPTYTRILPPQTNKQTRSSVGSPRSVLDRVDENHEGFKQDVFHADESRRIRRGTGAIKFCSMYASRSFTRLPFNRHRRNPSPP